MNNSIFMILRQHYILKLEPKKHGVFQKQVSALEITAINHTTNETRILADARKVDGYENIKLVSKYTPPNLPKT